MPAIKYHIIGTMESEPVQVGPFVFAQGTSFSLPEFCETISFTEFVQASGYIRDGLLTVKDNGTLLDADTSLRVLSSFESDQPSNPDEDYVRHEINKSSDLALLDGSRPFTGTVQAPEGLSAGGGSMIWTAADGTLMLTDGHSGDISLGGMKQAVEGYMDHVHVGSSLVGDGNGTPLDLDLTHTNVWEAPQWFSLLVSQDDVAGTYQAQSLANTSLDPDASVIQAYYLGQEGPQAVIGLYNVPGQVEYRFSLESGAGLVESLILDFSGAHFPQGFSMGGGVSSSLYPEGTQSLGTVLDPWGALHATSIYEDGEILSTKYAQSVHTHTQASILSESGWISDALGQRSLVGHSHAQGDINSGSGWITTALSLKSDVGHTHDYLSLSGGTIEGDLYVTGHFNGLGVTDVPAESGYGRDVHLSSMLGGPAGQRLVFLDAEDSADCGFGFDFSDDGVSWNRKILIQGSGRLVLEPSLDDGVSSLVAAGDAYFGGDLRVGPIGDYNLLVQDNAYVRVALPFEMLNRSLPANVSPNYVALYPKIDRALYFMPDTGSEQKIITAGTSSETLSLPYRVLIGGAAAEDDSGYGIVSATGIKALGNIQGSSVLVNGGSVSGMSAIAFPSNITHGSIYREAGALENGSVSLSGGSAPLLTVGAFVRAYGVDHAEKPGDLELGAPGTVKLLGEVTLEGASPAPSAELDLVLRDRSTGQIVSGGAVDAGLIRKYSAIIGDGVNLEFVVSHGLGSVTVLMQAQAVSDGSVVYADMQASSSDTSVFRFLEAPAEGSVRVVIIG